MNDRIGQQLGNYRLLRLIGRGGFADVYLGKHLHLNTLAAIKVLHVRLIGSNLDQFRSEARVMAALRGIIFDLDGTLLLSNEAHSHAWVDAFSTFGWEVPFFRTKWLIGMGGDRLIAALYPGMSESEGIGHVIAGKLA